MPPKLIPKSPYGISIWESIFINKFLHCQPTHRFLTDLSHLGFPISQGTVTGGLQRLKPLFEPVYEALQQQQVMEEFLFHNDETRWKVFEHVEGKASNLWWLWVSRSESVIFFQIAQSRGASVPVEYFEPAKERQVKIIIICDRYSAYKSLAKQLPFITLAFCWAHVRRDFLNAAQKHPDIEDWAMDWVKKIGELYHINNRRCREFDAKLPLQWQSPAFKKDHAMLIEKLDEMVQGRDAFLEENDPDDPDLNLLSKVKAKVLLSLKNHWEGLMLFVDHPKVTMDNNKGENAIRNPVTGRKAFYGSGSEWSSMLAAMMFSIFQTLGLWGVNPRHWLRAFLTACAQNNGQVPDDLSPFLPWQMDDDRLNLLSKPPPLSPPDTS